MTRTAEEINREIARLNVELAEAVQPRQYSWVVVRSGQSGVWLGQLVTKIGDEVTLASARRLWRWSGAVDLSQLSQSGVSKPAGCKFPPAIPSVTVLGVCEILPATSASVASIRAVPDWVA